MVKPQPDLAPGTRWFDDWYAIETIAPGVTAIGEPCYHQLNWNYLIAGRDSALLFDTGPGERDIVPVVRALSDQPVAAMASHMHYDHTGNLHRFAEVWAADLPVLRRCEVAEVLMVPDHLHLGSHEDRAWLPVTASRWIKPGEIIELGQRQLEVIATPGHAVDEVSLFDRAANILFAADFVYMGELYAQLPGSDLNEYLKAAIQLSDIIDDHTLIVCAHGKPDAQGAHASPKLSRRDILDLIGALERLRQSKPGEYRFTVNGNMVLLTSPGAFAGWQS